MLFQPKSTVDKLSLANHGVSRNSLHEYGVFYLALFLGMRYVSTQPRSSQDPSGDRVLLFSRDADTQHLVRSLFAPLIAVIPGKYVYPDRDPVEPAVELTEDLEKRAELTIAGAAGKGKQNHLR